jgi:hypothetical protein
VQTYSVWKVTNAHLVKVTVTQKDIHSDNEPEAWCHDNRGRELLKLSDRSASKHTMYICVLSRHVLTKSIEIEIEIVYNNTSINRLLSLGPPFCYAQPVVGLLSVR